MLVLTVNAGSSTLKVSLVGDGVVRASTTREWDGDREGTLRDALAALDLDGSQAPGREPDAVAHRVVHGGHELTRHVLVDDGVVGSIEAALELAPLHNAPALETLLAARSLFPGVPHVACFDTAFHATLPEAAARYPVPAEWHAAGIRRFGFHGLSVESAIGAAAVLLGRPATELRIVVAHLGSGCSVTAVDGGRSAWTSMGYTPLEGIMMATRPGSLDPGVVVEILRRGIADLDGLADALEHRSGMLGVSGRSGDVRELEAAADAGDPDARLALEMFVTRAAAGIGAAATWLPLLDAIAFTGGIGEHAARLRAAIVGRLAALGVPAIEASETAEDRVLAAGPPAVLRVAAREDLVMARVAESLVSADSASAARVD